MKAKVLFGKPVAEKIYKSLEKEIQDLLCADKIPTMAVILIGEDPASVKYIELKKRIAEKLRIDFLTYFLETETPQSELEYLINDLNNDASVDGILIQLPLPGNFDTDKILKMINPQKDIDGFLGKINPPTAQAILEIFKYYKIDLKNKKIILVGHGRLVGRPLEKLLNDEKIKPIICDSKTKDLTTQILQADVLISATGVPVLIKENMIKEGVILIDAGTAESKGKLVGDIDKKAYLKASAFAPSPGGIGPITVAILMRNLVEAAKKTNNKSQN